MEMKHELRIGAIESMPEPQGTSADAPLHDGPGGRPLVEATNLHVTFPRRGPAAIAGGSRFIRAVDGIDLAIPRREVLSLVGESGSGKTTVGRAILGLIPISKGHVTFDGAPVSMTSSAEMRGIRRRMQVVFQDPYASLHPRFKIGAILAEPLKIQGLGDAAERRERVRQLLEQVGLTPSAADRYPHQFSGGQRQRVAIARALALDPDFIVADEPVSALDVSIQAQILNLLTRLRRERQLAMLVISHDLGVVRHVSDRVAVMYLGRLVEIAPTEELFARPAHPYTIALMSAVPRIGPKNSPRRNRIVLKGDLPSPSDPPSGCRFHTRCWLRDRLGKPPECTTRTPPLAGIGVSHPSACHFASEAAKYWQEDRGDKERSRP